VYFAEKVLGKSDGKLLLETLTTRFMSNKGSEIFSKLYVKVTIQFHPQRTYWIRLYHIPTNHKLLICSRSLSKATHFNVFLNKALPSTLVSFTWEY